MTKNRRPHNPKTGTFEATNKPHLRTLAARFSEEEALQIASFAANYGLTTSEFTRQCMLEKIAHVPMLGGK